MQIRNLIVDDIDYSESKACVRSVIYYLTEPQWVSAHVERGNKILGPVTILENEPRLGDSPDFAVKSFPERTLHTEISRQRVIVSFRDRWTIPANTLRGGTLYTIVLPLGFVAEYIDMNYHAQTNWQPPPLALASSPDQRLFFHTLFQPIQITIHDNSVEWSDHIFDIELRLEENAEKARRMISSVDVVKGTRRYSSLVEDLKADASKSSFWFKIFETASKLLG